MRLVEQWGEVERGLPEGWTEARALVRVADEGAADRAAGLLGPATPGRRGRELSVTVGRTRGTNPDALRRLLGRLDRERIAGTLELLGTGDAPVEIPGDGLPPRHRPFAAQWADAAATLPDDWSDLLTEVALTSSDYLERAALLMSPLNPLRDGERIALSFRVAHTFGYGASPGMTRRCLTRCDEEGITGTLRVLRVLSDTDPVHTQGPVWYVGGRVL